MWILLRPLLLSRHVAGVPAHLCLSRRTQLSCQWQTSHYALTAVCGQLSAVRVPHSVTWKGHGSYGFEWHGVRERINHISVHNQLSTYFKTALIYGIIMVSLFDNIFNVTVQCRFIEAMHRSSFLHNGHKGEVIILDTEVIQIWKKEIMMIMRKLGQTLNTKQVHLRDEKMFPAFSERWPWIAHSTQAQ